MIMLTRNDKTISAYNPLVRLFPRLSISVISGKEYVEKSFIYLSIYFVLIRSSLFSSLSREICVRTHLKITQKYKSTLNRININLQIVSRPRGLSLTIAKSPGNEFAILYYFLFLSFFC